MKKGTLTEMKSMLKKMPKNLNEAIYDEMPYDEYQEEETPQNIQQDMPQEQPQDNGNLDNARAMAEKLIGDIRKEALKAMSALADTPEDPYYDILKKVFMMLEKTVTEKQEQAMPKNNA